MDAVEKEGVWEVADVEELISENKRLREELENRKLVYGDGERDFLMLQAENERLQEALERIAAARGKGYPKGVPTWVADLADGALNPERGPELDDPPPCRVCGGDGSLKNPYDRNCSEHPHNHPPRSKSNPERGE